MVCVCGGEVSVGVYVRIVIHPVLGRTEIKVPRFGLVWNACRS